jgi:predicted dehydrogenase
MYHTGIWNWPFGRKDMEVYGDSGYIITINNKDMRLGTGREDRTKPDCFSQRRVVYEDPFTYFKDVVRGKIRPPRNGLYTLENNVQVVKILEAAKQSAKEGRTVQLKD